MSPRRAPTSRAALNGDLLPPPWLDHCTLGLPYDMKDIHHIHVHVYPEDAYFKPPAKSMAGD